MYCRVRYFIKFKKKLDLKNPQTFNAKINWLKLHDCNASYTRLVDKHEVRAYITEKIGAEYLIPLHGVYERVEDIDFDALPDTFVLKGTHGAGWVLVCKDKRVFDKETAVSEMRNWMKTNFYKKWGEPVYKDVPPRIICETLLANPNGTEINDYKFICNNGSPKLMYVITNKFKDERVNFYDLDWNLLPYTQHCEQADEPIPKPENLSRMLELATVLSEGFKMVRVDLYEVHGQIYFGELTFYPSNGLGVFQPENADYEIGQLIAL